MAKVAEVFLNGTLGSLVFYRRMGTNCARIRSSHVRQSAATKIRSANFGVAAKAGKTLRNGLISCIPVPTDRSMQSRFSGAIAKWICIYAIDKLLPIYPVPCISTFPFTKSQPVAERFKVPFTISKTQENLVTVNIDPFIPTTDISAPAGTGWVTLVISVAGCMLKTGESLGNETHTIEIPYNDTPIGPRVLQFDAGPSAGSLLVTAGRLIYKKFQNNAWVEMNKEAFLPAGVINARYGN
jgi:hypothetical protein